MFHTDCWMLGLLQNILWKLKIFQITLNIPFAPVFLTVHISEIQLFLDFIETNLSNS